MSILNCTNTGRLTPQGEEQVDERRHKEQCHATRNISPKPRYVPLLQFEEAAPLFHAPTAMASPSLLEATP